MQLRLSVEGAAGNVLDSDFRDLVVPDYAKVEPLLSNPAVYRARTMRDANQIFGNDKASPTTAREFSRTERLVLRFQAYRARRRRRHADRAPAQSRRHEDGRRAA